MFHDVKHFKQFHFSTRALLSIFHSTVHSETSPKHSESIPISLSNEWIILAYKVKVRRARMSEEMKIGSVYFVEGGGRRRESAYVRAG